MNQLDELLKPYRRVLSFSSLPTEIDLSEVNLRLQNEGRLALSKMEKEKLIPYIVNDIERETRKFYHQVLEPDPQYCKKALDVDCILVPGLAFNEKGERLGRGIGAFDRLLTEHPNCDSIGVLFLEQVCYEKIPIESHDRSVKKLCIC